MTYFTPAHIATSVGLIADILGAGILTWGLFVKKDEAVRLSGVTGASYAMDHLPDQAAMVQQPAVQDRLAQSRRGKGGFVLLTIGFAFQLLGTWLN